MIQEQITAGHARRFMEHRWGQRVALGLAAHLAANGDNAPGKLRDASISGGFVETAMVLPLYTNLGIVVLVGAGDTQRAVELPACVTRAARDGVGIEWRDMACPSLLALLRESGSEFAHLTSRDRAFC